MSRRHNTPAGSIPQAARARSQLQRVRQAVMWVCSLFVALSFALAPRPCGGDDQPPAFPAALVEWELAQENPVFTAGPEGAWDAKIRERGWIMREGETWSLWYTGYDGSATGIRRLGYATSTDGKNWTRHPDNPLLPDLWVEDMQVVKSDGTYYMFAEGKEDRAQWLTSKDRVHWEPHGTLDVRKVDGTPIPPGPFGTPTAWKEKEEWHLFYERRDAGIWHATSTDLAVWTHVSDESVLLPGPGEYDRLMIAVNQIWKEGDVYFALYHGTGTEKSPRVWTTNIARSTDLVHWEKYGKNPLVPGNRSSGILVDDGRGPRLYTMHDKVELFVPRAKPR